MGAGYSISIASVFHLACTLFFTSTCLYICPSLFCHQTDVSIKKTPRAELNSSLSSLLSAGRWTCLDSILSSIMQNSTGFIEPILAGESVRRNSTTGVWRTWLEKREATTTQRVSRGRDLIDRFSSSRLLPSYLRYCTMCCCILYVPHGYISTLHTMPLMLLLLLLLWDREELRSR